MIKNDQMVREFVTNSVVIEALFTLKVFMHHFMHVILLCIISLH